MREIIDLQLARQRREETLREVATNRRATALRATRWRPTGRGSGLVWEMKRQAGRFRKFFGAIRKTG